MDRLVKNHFWIFNVLVIAAVAYITASLAADIAFHRIFKYPRVQIPKKKAKKKKKNKEESVDFANHLNAWSIFAKKKEEEKNPDNKTPKKKDEENVELSDLKVKLIGTVVVDTRPELSSAIVNINNEYVSVNVGSKLGETKAKVVAIYNKYIQVDEGNSKLKFIKLWDGTGGDLRKRPGRYKRPRIRRPRRRINRRRRITRRRTRTNYRNKVKKVGSYDYVLDKDMVKQNLSDLSDIARQARVVPTYRSGRFNGLKLAYVRYNSIYRAIGLRSGDVLRSVNGKPIRSPNDALKMFEKLKSSSSIKLGVERSGLQRTFSYKVQ